MREMNPEPEETRDERAEIEHLKEQLNKEHSMYLRALADCENYRKRVEREQAKAIRDGRKDLLLALVEIADEFDRALDLAQGDHSSLLEGFEIIHRLLQKRILAEGVIRFQSKGETFDPRLHEAAGTVAAGEHPPGSVVEEVRSGYRWGTELLRPARVIVAR